MTYFSITNALMPFYDTPKIYNASEYQIGCNFIVHTHKLHKNDLKRDV